MTIFQTLAAELTAELRNQSSFDLQLESRERDVARCVEDVNREFESPTGIESMQRAVLALTEGATAYVQSLVAEQARRADVPPVWKRMQELASLTGNMSIIAQAHGLQENSVALEAQLSVGSAVLEPAVKRLQDVARVVSADVAIQSALSTVSGEAKDDTTSHDPGSLRELQTAVNTVSVTLSQCTSGSNFLRHNLSTAREIAVDAVDDVATSALAQLEDSGANGTIAEASAGIRAAVEHVASLIDMAQTVVGPHGFPQVTDVQKTLAFATRLAQVGSADAPALGFSRSVDLLTAVSVANTGLGIGPGSFYIPHAVKPPRSVTFSMNSGTSRLGDTGLASHDLEDIQSVDTSNLSDVESLGATPFETKDVPDTIPLLPEHPTHRNRASLDFDTTVAATVALGQSFLIPSPVNGAQLGRKPTRHDTFTVPVSPTPAPPAKKHVTLSLDVLTTPTGDIPPLSVTGLGPQRQSFIRKTSLQPEVSIASAASSVVKQLMVQDLHEEQVAIASAVDAEVRNQRGGGEQSASIANSVLAAMPSVAGVTSPDVNVEDQVAAIRAEYDGNVAAVMRAADAERARQEADLHRRLEERRNARKAALLKKQEQELADATVRLASSGSGGSSGLSQLKKQHEQELMSLQDALRDEDAVAVAAVEEGLAVLQQSLQAKRVEMFDEFQNQVAAVATVIKATSDSAADGSSHSDAQVALTQLNYDLQLQKLKEERDADVMSYHAALRSECRRQENALRAKLELRREKRERTLRLHRAVAEDEMLASTSDVDRRLLEDKLERERAQMESDLARLEEEDRESLQDALRAAEAETLAQIAMRDNSLAMDTLRLEEQRKAKLVESGRSTTSVKASSGRANVRQKLQLALATSRKLPAVSAVLQRLTAKHEADLARLDAKQKAEQESAAATSQLEAERLAIETEEEAQLARRLALDAKQQELEARVHAASTATAEELARLKAEAQAEAESYAAAVADDRRRQKQALAERLEAKRARAQRDLLRRQEEERCQFAAAQASELAAAKSTVDLECDMQTLQVAVNDGKVSDDPQLVHDAIDVVLHGRHARELADLIARQYNERTDAIRIALEDVFARRRDEKLAAASAARESGASDDAVVAAMKAVDEQFELEAESAKITSLNLLEARHANEQVELRSRQLQEVSTALHRFAPTDVLKRQQAEQAAREADELREFQTALEAEKRERLAKLHRDKEEFETELRRKNEEELARLEAEHERQVAAEREQAETALRQRRERLMQEQEDLKRRKAKEVASMDDEERQRVMAEFESDCLRKQAALEAERARQLDRMQDKLKQRADARKRRLADKLDSALKAKDADVEAAKSSVAAEIAQRIAAGPGAAFGVARAANKFKHLLQKGEGSRSGPLHQPSPTGSSENSGRKPPIPIMIGKKSSRALMPVVIPPTPTASGLEGNRPTTFSGEFMPGELADVLARVARLEVMLKSMLGLSDAPVSAPLSVRRQASFSMPRAGLTSDERGNMDRLVRLFASVNVHVAVQVCETIPDDIAPIMRFKDVFGLSTIPTRSLHVKRSFLSNAPNDVTITVLHAAACLLVRSFPVMPRGFVWLFRLRK